MFEYLKFYEKLINWLQGRLSPRQFLIFSSILVGLSAGFAAVLLKTLVYYIHLLITYDYNFPYQYILYLVFPAIGILLTVLYIQYHLKGKFGRGTSNVLYAISKKASFLPGYQMYSQLITGAFTVGLGGSAGLESPMVMTGAAIGSNYSKTYGISYKDRTLLLACGAAAGIAAVFNAPIAGMLFALEVLLVNVSISAFIPLIIAAATGALLSKIILQEGILLSFQLQENFDYHYVPLYVILGILAGLTSVYYSRTFLKIESFFKPRKKKTYTKALIGGLLLAFLIFLFPPLFGEGYESIKTLSRLEPSKLFEHSIFSAFTTNKWALMLLILFTMFFKTIAVGLTIGSGGNGGNFAPSLFMGAFLGFAFATIINLIGIVEAPVINFTIVAMAGILSGIFHAPLTGIFLIAEITGGYELMIPLMIVSAISFLVSKYFEPFSMDTKRLAKKGQIFTADKDKNILSTLKTIELIETDFSPISPTAKLSELVNVVAKSKRHIFPVVDGSNLAGIIYVENIREIMFKQEMYDKVLVKELMVKPPAIISPTEDMQQVMKKFDETNSWHLPVINERKYLGFISKSSIYIQYRNKLIQTHDD